MTIPLTDMQYNEFVKLIKQKETIDLSINKLIGFILDAKGEKPHEGAAWQLNEKSLTIITNDKNE